MRVRARGVSTMEWGTRTAIETYLKRHNRVQDVVYDLGAVGKEPMIRLLAHRGVWVLQGWIWRLGEVE